jgi:hypothetical protein
MSGDRDIYLFPSPCISHICLARIYTILCAMVLPFVAATLEGSNSGLMQVVGEVCDVQQNLGIPV